MRVLKHHVLRDERGVTIMETMVVITVMTIVMLLVAQIFALTYDVYVKQAARIESETSAVLAARTISDLARGATQVLQSRTIDGTLYTTSSSVLVLELPSLDTSDAIIEGSYDYIAFARDPDDATRVIAVADAAVGSSRFDGERLVTAHNDTMTFRLNAADDTDASRVSILLVNETTVRGTTYQSNAWTSLFLRNK